MADCKNSLLKINEFLVIFQLFLNNVDENQFEEGI